METNTEENNNTEALNVEKVVNIEEAKKREEINFSWNIEAENNEKDYVENQWKGRTGLNDQSLVAAVESIIFMSDKPISIQKIKQAIDSDIPIRLIYDCVSDIQKRFDESQHGIRLTEVAEGYQFRTKVQHSKFIANIHKVPTINLSPLALEVMAIIAFKQPISKMEVDQMRGVDSGHLIRGLIEKNLVKVLGRSQETGKPSAYGTTNDFLGLFNLDTIEDLPTMNELLELVDQNSVGEIEDIKELVKTNADKFKFDEIDELDELKSNIKNISTNTAFTDLLNQKKKKKVVSADTEESEEPKSAFDILEDFVQEAKETEEDEALELNSIDEVEEKTEDQNNEEVSVEELEKISAQLSEDLFETPSNSELETLGSKEEINTLFDNEGLEQSLEQAFKKIEDSSLDREEASETQKVDEELDFQISNLEDIQKKLQGSEDKA